MRIRSLRTIRARSVWVDRARIAPRYNAVEILERPLKAFSIKRQRKRKITRALGEVVPKLETNLSKFWEVFC